MSIVDEFARRRRTSFGERVNLEDERLNPNNNKINGYSPIKEKPVNN
jgi:hypothetical protein